MTEYETIYQKLHAIYEAHRRNKHNPIYQTEYFNLDVIISVGFRIKQTPWIT